MEGYNRNKFYLSKLLRNKSFSILFIQEHWLPSHEACSKFESDFSDYKFLTTSSDSFTSPEDVLQNSGPVWHGTAIGWHSSISNNVSKLQIISSRFCGINIKINKKEILAFTVYLPTSGQDNDYLEEIALLTHSINKNSSNSPSIIIGLDANVSEKSTERRKSFRETKGNI